jgi:peptide/nickel transport system ATP-binding protein
VTGGPLLAASGLRRSYRLPGGGRRGAGTRVALDGVGLELAAGQRLGVVGGSGAGKSTLVRLLLALERADAGTVTYDGRPVAAGPPRSLRWFRRQVQVVLQDPNSSLDPRMTVGRIVAEPLECLRVPGDHRERVAEVLAEVELPADAARRYPHEFSGGQRQRIAIARALAPRPAVLVGDEPVSALDVLVRGQVLDLVQRLVRDHGLALLLVSHDLGVVRRACDDVLVLEGGRVVEHGPVARVLRSPEHPYTRQLLAAVPRLPAG